MMDPDPVHIALLAGGRSKRMRRNKALLQLGGQPLIERVLSAAEPLGLPIFIVGDPTTYAHLGQATYPDRYADLGPLGGLHTALTTASGPVLLLACDLPFLTSAFLSYMLSRRSKRQVVVPYNKEGSQPLCALYEPTCLPVIEAAIASSRLSMRGLLAKLEQEKIKAADWQPYDKRGLLFANLNTPEEFTRAQQLLEAQ